jgi:hypothetical protein
MSNQNASVADMWLITYFIQCKIILHQQCISIKLVKYMTKTSENEK